MRILPGIGSVQVNFRGKKGFEEVLKKWTFVRQMGFIGKVFKLDWSIA